MSNEKPKTAILRVRFVRDVKLGGNELGAWHHDKQRDWTADATAQGMVFTPRADGPVVADVVVPWANVISYERGARS